MNTAVLIIYLVFNIIFLGEILNKNTKLEKTVKRIEEKLNK